MGLIHSRASKKRDEAATRLLDAQRKQLGKDGRAAKHERQAESIERQAGAHAGNPWRQPTVGLAISTWAANRRAAKDGSGESGA